MNVILMSSARKIEHLGGLRNSCTSCVGGFMKVNTVSDFASERSRGRIVAPALDDCTRHEYSDDAAAVVVVGERG